MMNKIRDLIGKGKLELAIKELLVLKELLALDKAYKDEVLSLQFRLSDLETDKRRGVIARNDANIERNQITLSLLSLLSIIEAELPAKEDAKIHIEIESEENFEKIINRNGLQRIDWLEKGLKKAKSVCKIHTSDGYVGTGFLVEGAYIFTNNHVLSSAAIAQFSKVEFGYDDADASSIFYDLDHTDFITSKSLDYTRVKVKDQYQSPLLEWNSLNINVQAPSKKDALVIIQHPRGRTKEIAFSDGENSIWEHRLHYKVTTEQGSSGSPVFDINWNVVALHHAGGDMRINADGDESYVNEGILFKYILEDLEKQTKEKEHIKEPIFEKNEKISTPIQTMLIYHKKDAEYADEIITHLTMQVRKKKIEIFDMQSDVTLGANTNETLNQELENSTIVLILISNNLYRKETIDIALNVENYVNSKRVIPIKVSPFDLNDTVFEKLQGLPLGNKAINEYENQDTVLYEISIHIDRLIKSMI